VTDSGTLGTTHTGRTAFVTEFEDSIEFPTTFVAVTFVMTLAEFPSDRGAARKEVIGIVHYLLDMIAAFDPSQFVRSWYQAMPLLALISSL
jgi:hypothetical protein